MDAAAPGNLLRDARLRQRLSQEKLAIRAGVSKARIADIEDGRASLEIEGLCELLELLGEELVLHTKRRITGIDLSLNRGNLNMGPAHRVLKGLAFADLVRRMRPSGFAGLGQPLQLAPILGALDAHRVGFVVIGGIAGLVHGSAYPTYDLDLACARHSENLERLAAALGEIGIQIDEGTLDKQQAHSFDTQFGTLDILCEIPGEYGYGQLRRECRRERIAGVEVRVASLDHLIAMKRAANRPKDRLMVLEYVDLAGEIRRQEEDGES